MQLHSLTTTLFEVGGSISWNGKKDGNFPGFIFAATGCETLSGPVLILFSAVLCRVLLLS